MNDYTLAKTEEEARELAERCSEALTVSEQKQLVDDLDTFLNRELGIGVKDFVEYVTVANRYLEQRVSV